MKYNDCHGNSGQWGGDFFFDFTRNSMGKDTGNPGESHPQIMGTSPNVEVGE